MGLNRLARRKRDEKMHQHATKKIILAGVTVQVELRTRMGFVLR